VNRSNIVSHSTGLLALIGVMGFLRVLTLSAPDLIDTTEGQYASVAKLMVDRNDWITPWINLRGVLKPYLGEPPLHFWFMELSYLAFGQNEFAARLPGVLSAVGIGLCLWKVVRTLVSIEAAIASVSILASSCGVFLLSGAALPDMTWTLSVTIALTNFLLVGKWHYSGHLFFIGAGLGVLVKGPLAVVLIACTIAPWACIRRMREGRWPIQFSMLPWVSGGLVLMAIIIPWHLCAEFRNPGFLGDFFWKENISRYLSASYGDEFSSERQQLFGAAFTYFLPALFPWSLVMTGLLIATARYDNYGRDVLKPLAEDPLVLYSLAWTLTCTLLLLVFPECSAAYLAPSFPGFALLLATLWEHNKAHQWCSTEAISCALRTTIAGLGIVLIIGATASLWYSNSILTFALSVLTGFSLLSLSLHPERFRNELTSIVYVSVFCCGVYACAILSFDRHLSENQSTRITLEKIRAFPNSNRDIKVGFPFYFPSSATFYGPLSRSTLIDAIQIDEAQLSQSPPDLIVVRKRDIPKLRGSFRSLEQLAVVGQWHILRSR